MDVSLPGPDSAFSRSPPPAIETPRRHLKQLSLASSSSPLIARPSPSFSSFGSPSGAPRSPASRPPGSIGRRSGRQSSISYSPSIRSVAPDGPGFDGGSSGRASPVRGGFPPRSSSDGTPLDPIESGRSSGEYSGRIPLGDRNGRLPVQSTAEKAAGEAADVPSPLPSTGRARSRSSLSIGSNGSLGDREPSATSNEPLTLGEQCVVPLPILALLPMRAGC